MKLRLLQQNLLTALALVALLPLSTTARGQAMVGAERGAELAPFGMATVLSPDWGPTHNLGYTVGLDYTHFIRSIVQPSLEARLTSANGSTVNESSYSGGLKLQASIHGIHPYATVLAGRGTIKFNYNNGNYYGDASIIYSFGGGAEFNVTPAWKVRVDYTHQHWNLNPNTLTPTAVGIGLAYRLPFFSGQSR